MQIMYHSFRHFTQLIKYCSHETRFIYDRTTLAISRAIYAQITNENVNQNTNFLP